MNQPEHELAKKITRHLDLGLDQIDARVRDRLAGARRAAMAGYREQPQPAFGLAWAGQAAARMGEYRIFGVRSVVVIGALMLALIGITYSYWQTVVAPANEVADLETALLTDELPINAYLDKGFDSWLKRSSR